MAPSRWLVPLCLILSASMSAGCLQDVSKPSKSFSSIPEVLLDYQQETGETRLWVMSVLSHVRYDNITLVIEEDGGGGGTWADNHTYFVNGDTNATAFTLTAEVRTEEKDFYLVCRVELIEVEPADGEDAAGEDAEPGFFYHVTIEPPEDRPGDEPKVVDIATEDLPWKKTLEERAAREE